jgi:Fe-S-cluster-containing dehydrogenase component/DMSO reductase anchor subunit
MPALVQLDPLSYRAKQEAAPQSMTLIDRYLLEQQELTAVERFSRQHEAHASPLQARYYESLLPAAPPQPGEQYAFEVDLDACSGCKSCVVACHSLNGLDESETWRNVGMLHGSSGEQPFMQHVTAACHHCVDPACLNVCPVRAYEKDLVTGIVKHLDDQCIGCQYCVLACPYDVPQYNAAKGIVRKCDMCSNRLKVGEAPACVQSCPNAAIRVTTVRVQEVIENCEAGAFLPGEPDPHLTQPTTHYKTNRPIPRNALPADYYSVAPEHAHWPLVAMLVLTQLSVGAFLVELLAEFFMVGRGLHTVDAGIALGFGLMALGASTLHLGRPHLAFRAVLGLRSSWLSREIVAFGLFAGLAVLYAGSAWLIGIDSGPAHSARMALGTGVVGAGLAGVVCSIMIYQKTRRPFWNGPATATRFLLTTVVLGLAAALFATVVRILVFSGTSSATDIAQVARLEFPPLILAVALKLLFEAALFLHLQNRQLTPLKRSALLLTGDLAKAAKWRFALGAIGGLALPGFWLALADPQSANPAMLSVLIVGQFAMLLAGELCERYLFFTAAVAPSMPGGLRT